MALIPILTVAIGIISGIVQLLEWLHAHPEVTAPMSAAITEAKLALQDARETLQPHVAPPPEAP